MTRNLYLLTGSMEQFLKCTQEGEKFELLIDTRIFNKDIILKSAYSFLDRGYFFFSFDENGNIILQFTKKPDVNIHPETIIGEFSDELLAVYLRNKLEIDNKAIRETIIEKAINGPLDMVNFVSLETDDGKQVQNQIDFEKDIDEILKEIENDPDLKIDEEEIAKILKEIEEEAGKIEITETKITLDTNALKDVKAKFQNR